MRKRNLLIALLGGLLIVGIFLKARSLLNRGGIFGQEAENINLKISNDYMDLDGIKSRYALVIDKEESTIIRGKNLNKRIHPASMTKVMTAIIGIENAKDLGDRVEISQDILDLCMEKGLSVSGFQLGDRPKLLDLLYGILLESGGESSMALARYISNSEEDFIGLMNDKAFQLGMEDTHFSNVTGMTDEFNYSTVEDIGKLFLYASRNKKFVDIIGSQTYQAKGLRGTFTKHTITNALFIKRAGMGIDKDYIKYGKTGYTDAAGLCLVSIGEVNGREYIVVVAGADGNSQTEQFNLSDTEKIYRMIGGN